MLMLLLDSSITRGESANRNEEDQIYTTITHHHWFINFNYGNLSDSPLSVRSVGVISMLQRG